MPTGDAARGGRREWKISAPRSRCKTARLPRYRVGAAADALYRVLDHLRPLRDSSRSAGDGKERGEHLNREAERLERYPRIEVDIRIELLLDEIVVTQRDPL